MATTYTARCWREGSSWVVHLPELGQAVIIERLSQVEAVARDVVARHGGEGAADPRVVIDVRDHEGSLDGSERVALSGTDVGSPDVRYAEVGAVAGDAVAGDAVSGDAMAGAVDLAAAPAPAAGRRPRPHGAYRHEALVYRGDEDFLAGTVPFVLDAVSLGQPVLVAVTLPRLVQLQAVVGPDAPGVEYVDMGELGGNPARIIPAWRSFVDRSSVAGAPVRGIGEPVWAGRRATEITECQLHEALLNVAIEPDTPLWLLCPYDADSLPEPVLSEVAHSHPSLREGARYRGSTTYGGVHHVDRLFEGPLPPPPPGTPSETFEPGDLAHVRRQVRRWATAAGLDDERTSDLTLAVTEVATNSVRHGGGRGVLRLWRQAGALACEITDRGRIRDPLAGRRAASLTDEGGRGLWLTNQLCDLVQIRSGTSGTVVRLLSWL